MNDDVIPVTDEVARQMIEKQFADEEKNLKRLAKEVRNDPEWFV